MPSAIFLDMIELAMSGIDSTVAVTSRRAYSLRSAGHSVSLAAQITAPTSRSWATIWSFGSVACQPGMASSLSSVPPVWPSPRPESWGTAAPHAATSGASGSDTLSPTPPVECLSTVGRGTDDRSMRSPESIIAWVHDASSSGSMPRSRMAMHSAAACSSATRAGGVAVDEEPHLLVGQPAAVALGADDVEYVGGHYSRSSGPNAPGSHSAMRISLTTSSDPPAS